MKMPLVAFDLVGPMAHFRKFYTNSSSLSYHVPPRTVLMGVVAALLGWQRNSYYERLSLTQAAIGVSLRVPVRSVVQSVNLLQTKVEDWHGVKSRTQIPTEWVLPKGWPQAVLRYRVFFAHRDPGVTRDLAARVLQERYVFPLFLGVASCPAWVEQTRLYEPDQIVWAEEAEVAHMDTVVLRDRLAGERLPLQPGTRILPDRMPLDFAPGRTLRAVASVLWEDNGHPLPLMVRGRRFHLPEDEEGVWHTFLEGEDAPF